MFVYSPHKPINLFMCLVSETNQHKYEINISIWNNGCDSHHCYEYIYENNIYPYK